MNGITVPVWESTNEKQRRSHDMCVPDARRCPRRRQPQLQPHHPRSVLKASHPLPPLQPNTRRGRTRLPSRLNPSGKPCLRRPSPCLTMEWYAKPRPIRIRFAFGVGGWISPKPSQPEHSITSFVRTYCVLCKYGHKEVKEKEGKKKKVSRSLETSVLAPHPFHPIPPSMPLLTCLSFCSPNKRF